MKWLLLVLAALVARPGDAAAQLSAGYEYLPAAEVDKPAPGTFAEGVRVSASVVHLRAVLPIIRRGDDLILLAGASFHPLFLGLTGWDAAQEPTHPRRLYRVQPEVVLVDRFAPAWRLIGFAQPGLQSDLHRIGLDHGALQGVILLDHVLPALRATATRFLGVGLYYSSDFGRNSLVPLVHVDIPGRIRVAGIIPLDLEAMYGVMGRLDLGVGEMVDGAYYRLGRHAPGEPDIVRQTNGFAGPIARYRIAPFVKWELRGGMMFYRRFRLYDGAREVRRLDPEDGFFIGTSLRYGP